MYVPRRILVIDDERSISDTLEKIFSTNGYEARAAYTAEQAGHIVTEWLPDLVIIDVVLPGMNGIEFASLLTVQYPHCQLLLLSGDTRTSDLLADAATKGHAFDILAKPVHPTVILERAEKLLAHNQIERLHEPAE